MDAGGVPDPFRIFAAFVMGIASFVMLSLALLSYVHTRRVGDDVLRSRMFLKSHLLQRGYLIFILASVGMFLLGIPLALEADIPSLYYPAATIFVMAALDLAILYFYSLVAPKGSRLSMQLSRLAKLLGGGSRGEQGRNTR